ncbi:hypothetical protein CAPTEDRAFT_225100 [Capitella teleta]|uniref:RAP domain-containing protein n=1 Tax=Capitella teleta TaxID=283909 RepID=R7TLY5_CAPTE|nr:hypothetical protein CAPTEDRAFT_225100 [Capitella teleta]|eukprot:ELT94542.1 hypothetical protein CAPTEDRAFT_225100 [Capitella teleta]
MLRGPLCRALSLRHFPHLAPCAALSSRAHNQHVSQLIACCKQKDLKGIDALESDFQTKAIQPHSCTLCLIHLSRTDYRGVILEKLEDQVEEAMWTQLSLRDLASLCFDYKPTHEHFTENLKKVIEKRHKEVECDATLAKLFENIDPDVHAEIYRYLEAMAVQRSSEISASTAYRIVCALGRNGQKSKPLLIVLADILTENLSQLSTRDLSYLALSYAKLGFCSNNLMSGISKELVDRKVEMPLPSLLSLFNSFSHLRWFQKEAVDTLSALIVKHPLEAYNWKSLVISCGRLTYLPPAFKELLSSALPSFSASLHPKQRLDVAFNLAVNDALPVEEAKEILSAEFVDKLMNADDLDSAVLKLKLQSIGAVSDSRATGTELSAEEIEKMTPSLSNLIIKTMEAMATPGKHFNASVASNVGCILAVETVIDEEGKIQPLSHLDKLEAGWRKVAIMPLTINDVIQPSLDPVGFHQLSYRLLTKQGYTVLPILAREFNRCTTVVSKVKFLEKKLKQLS